MKSTEMDVLYRKGWTSSNDSAVAEIDRSAYSVYNLRQVKPTVSDGDGNLALACDGEYHGATT